ncbi:MbcA/ParS/Xre antitoxin family protein [Aromatoleum evansii]|uniref:MbcA/ParS/Xre antitoxin family protein n=1 Tax=Aromatoleum evansii TaxID=59406 RepID=A0ABZ1ALI5_AROEV|nr:MbcA/ParS/Xre antitoxin family protein [Aromatoleum evansii]
MDRIEALRAGIESLVLIEVAKAMGHSVSELIELLQLGRHSPVGAVMKGNRLTTEQSERILAFLRLVEAVDDMVRATGQDKAFDAPRWIGDWLASPCPALGGRHPAALTDTLEGFRVLERLLSQMQSGAYA